MPTMVAKASKGKAQHQLQPALFPCAAGVSMPQLGAEDTDLRRHLRKPERTRLSLKPPPIDDTPVNQRYLTQISTDLVFAEEVVKERCFHMMPYDSSYLAEVLDVSDIIPHRPRLPLVGRHNARGPDLRHLPCGLKRTKPPQLRPLKKKLAVRALAMSTAAEASEARGREEASESSHSVSSSRMEQEKPEKKSSGTFLTEVAEEGDEKPKQSETLQKLQEKLKDLKAEAEAEEEAKQPKIGKKGKEKDWDTYLMSKLSQMTATWIVHERMSPSQERQDLMKSLHGWYGKPKNTDLVQERGSDSEDDPDKKDQKVKPKKKWKKKEASLLERVYSGPSIQRPAAADPYSDENEAPFYRQPAGIRRQKKYTEKEEAGAINSTAHRIKVKSVKEPKPPTLRDFMPPGVGSKILDTNNQYQQELLTGVGHVYQKDGDGTTIITQSDHKYKKVLRPDYPNAPEKWYAPTEAEKRESAGSSQAIKREYKTQRWMGLPEPYDDTFEAQKVVPPGFDVESSRPVDPNAKKQIKQNPTLMRILHDWRAKWNMSGQFADASYDDIIKDMADIQPHVRLKAIATVGKAAEYKPPVDPGIKLQGEQFEEDSLDVPERVFTALECLLEDANSQVQKAAAITLYALDHPSAQAEAILRSALKSEVTHERWAAAQCLAHYGICDSHVVDEIIKQLLGSEESIKHEQGIALLAKISNSTTLVHSMVAEQLNSSSWRHRVIACKILPALSGSINKDLTHKLTYLMWHDWHKEVRRAAAQCLGKTSHGRDVHDDIRRAIMYGSERIKLEAISRLGQLGIMTAKLLPAFLDRFDDQYVSIRSECCITCSNLVIQDEQVIKKLIHLATFDPIWKVKALAIQALGKIGVVSEAIKECLLWAMRYEEKAGVRAEACHSLVMLDILDEDVVECLQDRLLVESSQIVRDEMIQALQNIGLNASEDLDTVAQIKMEVRKLCHRNVIASQIVLNENDELRQQNLLNMIYVSEEEAKEKQEQRKESALQRMREMASISEQAASATPGPKAGESEVSVASTPDAGSREGTLFTPSADKELEAILMRVEAASEPSGASSATGKSRPISEETQTSGTYSSPETSSRASKPFMPEEYIQEVDRQLQSSAMEAAPNTAFTPLSRSRLGITPTASMHDMKAAGSQLSLQLSGRRTVLSRETLAEREKLDEQVSSTYLGLSARYSDMINEISKLDRGLSLLPPSQEQAYQRLSQHLMIPGSSGSKSEVSAGSSDNSDTSKSGEKKTDLNLNAAETSSEELEEEEKQEEVEGDVREGEMDGQVAISLEVPISENHTERAVESLEYPSDEDKGAEDGQSTTYSTDYPSLGDDHDVAPSYIDDSVCDVAPSTFGGSMYRAGQASEYETSGPSDIDNESTLD